MDKYTQTPTHKHLAEDGHQYRAYPANFILSARLFGYAGLIPFLSLALASFFVRDNLQILLALKVYAALILAFLGGVHWGRQLYPAKDDDHRQGEIPIAQPTRRSPQILWLGWSVTPSLLAWPAVMLSEIIAFPYLAGLFLICWAVDNKAYKIGLFPLWMRQLRTALTVGVITSLLGAWLGLIFLGPKLTL